MSAELDPTKLKVVELRAELQARGLDVKGNKPVLIKRLQEALEAEQDKDETAETSALESTVASEAESDGEEKPEEPAEKAEPERESSPEPVKKEASPKKTPQKEAATPTSKDTPEAAEPEPKEETKIAPKADSPKKESEPEPEEQVQEEAEAETPEENCEPEEEAKDEVKESIEENGTNGEAGDEDTEPKNRKSRWGSDAKSQVEEPEPMEADGAGGEEADGGKTEGDSRGEKRRHPSPSPERQQRRRSRSPDNEDEPVIESSNVQLSWYDSDLHLEIDKETFLSAKPLNDGAFGYIWSGARLTHGIKSGKACYEVKIAEEMKFDDMLKIVPLKDHRKERNDGRKHNRGDYRNKKQEKKDKLSEKSEEKTEETDETKMETETSAEDAPKKDEVTTEEEKEDVKKEDEEEKDEEKEEVKNDDAEKEEVKNEEEVEEDKKEGEDDKKEDDEDKKEEDEDEEKEEEIKPEEEHNIPTHIIRIGWSVGKSSLQLGEDEFSYGLESSGKFFVNKEITENDITFAVGDVVTSYLEFTETEIVMTFAVNGEKKFEHTVSRENITDEEFTLFPHVITRNFSYQVNVGKLEEPLAAKTEGFEEYPFIDSVEEKVRGETGPTSRKECEVIMMCGLPASGKSHWVNEHVEKTTDRKYHIIGISSVLERMTVDAKPIEEKISKARWNVVMDKLTKCLNRMCELAAMRRRDFILDQTNVFPSAQRRKMRSFWGFRRHAVIVVNEDEEQARRLKQQESQTGKDLPESTVLEMKAIMSVPRTGEWLEKVTFVSLQEAEAKAQVQKYNAQGKEAGFGTNRRDRYDYNNRWGHGTPRRDYRVNFRDNRLHHNNRYSDRGGYRQGGRGGGDGWRSGGGGGGWMRNERRDSRGPRDWRNNRGGMIERHRGGAGGNRDHRHHGASGGGGSGFNRNRNMTPSGGRNHGGNWGNQQSGWNNQNHQGGWGGNQGQNQNWNQGWNQAQGNWNQNQWKYGGGYNQSGYGQYASWNYYGQYAQNWNAQQNQSGQLASTTTGTTTSNTTTDSTQQQQQYAQMTPQQQQAAWAQYAQQYAQSTGAANTNTTQK